MFTQKDLSYLDDIMPEIVKRSKEDGKDVNEIDEYAAKTLVPHFFYLINNKIKSILRKFNCWLKFTV